MTIFLITIASWDGKDKDDHRDCQAAESASCSFLHLRYSLLNDIYI